jgi:hypothetical protein
VSAYALVVIRIARMGISGANYGGDAGTDPKRVKSEGVGKRTVPHHA